jgi:hypothetical protein
MSCRVACRPRSPIQLTQLRSRITALPLSLYGCVAGPHLGKRRYGVAQLRRVQMPAFYSVE